MNCQAYLNLSTEEKVKMIGEIIHAMQNDPVAFMTCRGIINGARARGKFEGVTILPEREKKTVNEQY